MKFFIRTALFFSILLFLKACTSTSFTKRKYLSGRYIDKKESPEKSNTLKTDDFIALKDHALITIDFCTEFNSTVNTINKENQVLSDNDKCKREFIKNKNSIIASDSTQIEKKTFKNKFRNIINFKPKKVYKTAMPYLAFASLNLAVSLGVFISGAVIFSTAFFGGLELLSILLIPGVIILCVIFYYLILLFTKGFENFKSFNVFNKIIYVISSILILPSGFFIPFGLAAAIIGAIYLLIKGVLFLVALL